MSWKDRAITLYKRFGAPAKFAAKMILGAALPGGSAVVDLVGEVLDCVHETAKDNLTVESASAADLQRVEEVLAVLTNELNPLMAQIAALADLPDRAAQVLEAAVSTDEHCRQALYRLDHLPGRFDRLEEQNKKLLEGQGYATGLLVEMLPLMRRMVGTVDVLIKGSLWSRSAKVLDAEWEDLAEWEQVADTPVTITIDREQVYGLGVEWRSDKRSFFWALTFGRSWMVGGLLS